MNNPKSKGGRPIIHGRTTKQSKEERKAIRELLKVMESLMKNKLEVY